MTYDLRPYQQEAVDLGAAFLLDGKRHRPRPRHGLLVEPTGSGKSLVIAGIVRALDGPALVFQPTREILEQNYAKLVAYGEAPAIYSASLGRRQVGDITLATIGSVRRLRDLFAAVRYVLIDECHLVNSKGGMYRDFLASLGAARALGLTATPYRLTSDGYGGSILKFLTRTRPHVFTELVHATQVPDLYRDGYLAPLRYKIVPFDRSALRPNTTGADYTDASVQRAFWETGFAGRLQEGVARLVEAGRQRVLVFTRFVEEAARLSEAVPGAAVLTGETPPAERRRIVEGFKAARIPVVANVGVLGLGFDYPELDTVVLARPTMSLAVYYQQVGRVIRPHPEKPYATVIDMVGLVEQFGPIEQLTLRGGGKRGRNWEICSGDRPLTNIYFGRPSGQEAR